MNSQSLVTKVATMPIEPYPVRAQHLANLGVFLDLFVHPWHEGTHQERDGLGLLRGVRVQRRDQGRQEADRQGEGRKEG